MAQDQALTLIPITLPLVKRLLPKRPRNADKEYFGRAFVVAGSKGMIGAALLASRAVLRAGAGISILGVPQSLADLVDAVSPEVMTIGLAETTERTLSPKAYKKIKEVAERMKALAIGPGLSRNARTTKLEQKIYTRLFRSLKKLNLVIDADGLNGLRPFAVRRAEYLPVITPHAGELARLLKITRTKLEQDPVYYARKAAKRFKVIVVLKGEQTIVVDPSALEVLYNTTGNPGMATGGSGDVLTGVITGFIVQGMEPRSAAVLGVFIHGLAGNIAAMLKGQDGIIASDILNNVPLAIKRVRGK